MRVSFVVPARDAAATLAEALDSLLAQTHPNWEAVVVDDGSQDSTPEVAARFAGRDERIRLLRQPPAGLSAARNAGVEATRHDWLVFLDADDWLVPSYLERMTSALAADGGLDAVHCGWVRIGPDGTELGEGRCVESGDLFPVLARRCPFTVQACIVRRSLVVAVGGFDVTLAALEDWDLWQRIARAGARFGALPETLACYRVRPGSMSFDASRMLEAGLRVLARGHGPDPRVPRPAPAHAAGLSRRALPAHHLNWAAWVGGLVLARGGDARPLLRELPGTRAPDLDPNWVAESLFHAVPLAWFRPPAACVELWPGITRRLDDFLAALELKAGAPRLERRVGTRLERMILLEPSGTSPLTIGRTHTVRIDVARPLPDLLPPPPAERVVCFLEQEGSALGSLELPVCDGVVPASVVADAAAAEFGWPILGRFFERSVYRELERGVEDGRLWFGRGGLRIPGGVPDDRGPLATQIHDWIGWAILLQEVWGLPEWGEDRFYEVPIPEAGNGDEEREPAEAVPSHPRRTTEPGVAGLRPTVQGWLEVELSLSLSDVEVGDLKRVDVVPRLGGVPLGLVPMTPGGRRLQAQELRSAITIALGFELCRAVVREAVLGRPLADGRSLRERLAEAALQTARKDEARPVTHVGTERAAAEAALERVREAGFDGFPGAPGVLMRALAPARQGVVHGRHPDGPIDSPVSRRASLPTGARAELLEAALVHVEPVLRLRPVTDLDAETSPSGPTDQEGRTAYVPELVWRRGAPAARDVGMHAGGGEVAPLLEEGDAGVGPARGAAGERGRLHGRDDSPSTEALPILVYRRIASSGAAATARYRVSPSAFAQQLTYLRETGYRTVTLEEWRLAIAAKRPLAGRAVLLTFDDGYRDFLTHAWPLLKSHGFGATVFVVADEVGEVNQWDEAFGEQVPLLGWGEILSLRAEGVEFGSHTATRAPLTGLSPEEVVREAARSRALLTRVLGEPVRAIAYPYGESDPVVEHLAGACGYLFGLTCRAERSRFKDSLLALPRIEISGTDDLEGFVAKLHV